MSNCGPIGSDRFCKIYVCWVFQLQLNFGVQPEDPNRRIETHCVETTLPGASPRKGLADMCPSMRRRLKREVLVDGGYSSFSLISRCETSAPFSRRFLWVSSMWIGAMWVLFIHICQALFSIRMVPKETKRKQAI